MEEIELKNCPFCGSEARTAKSEFDGNEYIQCSMKDCFNNSWFTRQEWNHRATERILQNKINVLMKFCEFIIDLEGLGLHSDMFYDDLSDEEKEVVDELWENT